MNSAIASPLRHAAPVRLDDVTSKRLWRGVVARRAERRTRSLQRWTLAWVAVGALLGTVVTLSVQFARARLEHTEVAGPLLLADGTPLGVVAAPAEGSRSVSLADGSHLDLDSAARVEPLENSAHVVSLLLARGRATFDVRPNGPRRWSIECGLATVEVVGTSFALFRTADRLTVDVSRGVVLVRGERVPDRVQRLTAGQHLDVVAREEKPSPPPAEATGARTPDAVKRAPTPWQELSTRGDYASAYRLLGRRGIDAESTASTKIDELMALGDVARLSGHPSDAVAPLSRVVREFSRDPRASLAAFTLGKIRLATPEGARAAAADFRDALRLGLPETLAEDAYGYIVEALRRAGDDSDARSAAFDYARRYPASPRAADLRAWADRR